jgi:hypothetical protein
MRGVPCRGRRLTRGRFRFRRANGKDLALATVKGAGDFGRHLDMSLNTATSDECGVQA